MTSTRLREPSAHCIHRENGATNASARRRIRVLYGSVTFFIFVIHAIRRIPTKGIRLRRVVQIPFVYRSFGERERTIFDGVLRTWPNLCRHTCLRENPSYGVHAAFNLNTIRSTVHDHANDRFEVWRNRFFVNVYVSVKRVIRNPPSTRFRISFRRLQTRDRRRVTSKRLP